MMIVKEYGKVRRAKTMTELAILMIKTVVTTIDVMFGAVLVCGKNGNQKEKAAYVIFMLGNILAMWI